MMPVSRRRLNAATWMVIDISRMAATIAKTAIDRAPTWKPLRTLKNLSSS